MIAEREIDEPKGLSGAGWVGEAAFRRINSPSNNDKIHGKRFVKARVLACFLSGTCAGAGPSWQVIVASVDT